MLAPEIPLPGARERMLREATRIFATKGYDKASTREICQAAGVNIASIHYYFGDKQGLYREALIQPMLEVLAHLPAPDAVRPLRDWLCDFYGALLLPLRMADSDLAHLMRLMGREMMEPSAAYDELCSTHIAPQHQALIEMLRQRCGAAEADMGLQQLAHALTAMAHDYWMSADFMESLAPGVARGPGAYERVLERLVAYGEALVERETALRRRDAAPVTSTPSTAVLP
ncbi:CerR family C-terminal domain-containing protein [Roseateles sp. DAIF2]|uniref:CerR family C-terminal domain-containing protein n=1 Tax=Roseateles sp. DAIF2 TaxID=2714952 RepID=UPI0018A285EC|nr:CerR family C-terminal domain-containing protein [Roseateles sp. DAIF2]QPF72637.1 CerR family C-terminal domain-containing protein [Roseateles sp. DAIF2]